jgi:hypothetical protein
LRIEALEDGRHALVVDVVVLRGWRAYADVPKGGPYIQTELEAPLPKGMTLDGEWIRPTGSPDAKSSGLTTLSGKKELRCFVTLTPDVSRGAKAIVKLNYQVCDEHVCLPPATIEIGTIVPQRLGRHSVMRSPERRCARSLGQPGEVEFTRHG